MEKERGIGRNIKPSNVQLLSLLFFVLNEKTNQTWLRSLSTLLIKIAHHSAAPFHQLPAVLQELAGTWATQIISFISAAAKTKLRAD